MSDFRIHTLGCGSAKPTVKHQPSSTVVEHRGTLYMVDCGEGAQLQFQKQRLKFGRLRHIFLTHLHGDHVLGLPGLVSTLALGGKEGKLTIHTFKEGKEILEQILGFFARELSFELDYDIIRPEEKVILDTGSLRVRTIPLKHRVPTVGYVFEEAEPLRHIRRDMCDFHGVPVFRMREIKEGADFVKADQSRRAGTEVRAPVRHAVYARAGGQGRTGGPDVSRDHLSARQRRQRQGTVSFHSRAGGHGGA